MHNFHEFASMFPIMEGEDFDALVADIEANGQHEPIVMLEDKVLDGRNRWLACERLKRTPRMRDFNCIDGDPLAYVWSQNVVRRHLTASQRSIAKAKQVQFYENGGDRRSVEFQSATRQTEKPITTKQAASEAATSERSIERAKAVLKYGTEEDVKDIESGKKKVYQVDKEINDRLYDQNITRGGRIVVPSGLTIEDWARQGLALEEDGFSAESAAKKIECPVRTYRALRDIVRVYDRRKGLPASEAKKAEEALEDINRNRQIKSYELVKDIAARIWGGGGLRSNKTESRRKEEFGKAINVIIYGCGADIDIPHLSKEEATNIVKELKKSISDLNGLISKIKEIYLDG